MIDHEVTASELNDAVLLDLIGHEDPLGVLSVYVEMPVDGADRRAEIEIKNRLADLEPRARGRGGAVFAALGGSSVISLTTAMPLASRVVLDPRPFVRPLLAVLDEGEPAGVVLVSAREVELLDWRLGELRHRTRVIREPEPERGPSTAARDQRARHDRERLLRWIGLVATDVLRLSGEHDGERLLISGDERLTRPLLESLPAELRADALLDARQLHEHDRPALAAAPGADHRAIAAHRRARHARRRLGGRRPGGRGRDRGAAALVMGRGV